MKKFFSNVRSKILVNFVLSYMGVLLLTFGLLGVIASMIIRDNLRKEENRFIENKLNIIVSDMEKQQSFAWNVLVDISTMPEYDLFTEGSTKYKELEMLEMFSTYRYVLSSMWMYDEYFLKYVGNKNIYHSNKTISFSEVYCSNLFGKDEADQIVKLLDEIAVEAKKKVYYYKNGDNMLFVYPTRLHSQYTRRDSVLVFLLSEKGLESWVKSRLGNLGGAVRLYYKGQCMLDQSATDVAPDYEFVSSEGNFSVQYWRTEHNGLSGWISTKVLYLGAAGILGIMLVICYVSWRNYLPARNIVRKFHANENDNISVDWVNIEKLYNDLIMERDASADKILQLHRMLREHLLKMIVLKKYSEELQHLLLLCNIKIQDRYWGLLKGTLDKKDGKDNGAKLICELQALPEDVIAWLEVEDAFYILISSEEKDLLWEHYKVVEELMINICDSYSLEMERTAGTLEEMCMDSMQGQNLSDSNEECAVTKCESIPNQIVQKAIAYIDEHFMDYEIGLEVMAKELQVTGPYLSRIIKQHMNMSYKEYITQLRMREAERLLLETEYSVGDICKQVGYSHVSYFIKLFQTYAGETPSKYRENQTKSS